MKKWHNLLPNWALALTLTLLVLLCIGASYYELSVTANLTVLSVIPVLLFFYFLRQPVMAHLFVLIFGFYFLGLLFYALDNLSLSLKLSESSFLGVYALLLVVMVPKLKRLRLETLIFTYLSIILLVNGYLGYIVFNMLKDSFADSVILTLTASKSIALMLVSFLAFIIYLSEESLQSIIFLITACCFVFADALSLIGITYVHYWVFEAIQKILQGVGLLLLCIYVFNHHQSLRYGSKRPVYRAMARQSDHIPV